MDVQKMIESVILTKFSRSYWLRFLTSKDCSHSLCVPLALTRPSLSLFEPGIMMELGQQELRAKRAMELETTSKNVFQLQKTAESKESSGTRNHSQKVLGKESSATGNRP